MPIKHSPKCKLYINEAQFVRFLKRVCRHCGITPVEEIKPNIFFTFPESSVPLFEVENGTWKEFTVFVQQGTVIGADAYGCFDADGRLIGYDVEDVYRLRDRYESANRRALAIQ
jgi:hypothetical protein